MPSRSLSLENAKGRNESESTWIHTPRGSSAASRMKRVHYLRTNSAFDAGALARSTDSLDVKTEIVNTSTGLIKSTTLIPKKSALSIRHLSSEDRPLPNRAPSATSGVASSSVSFSSFQTPSSSLSKKYNEPQSSSTISRKNVAASRFTTPLPPQRAASLSKRSAGDEQRNAIATLKCFESTLTFIDPQDINGSNLTPSQTKHKEAAITTEPHAQSLEILAVTVEHKNSISEISTSPGDVRESSSSSDGRPSLINSQTQNADSNGVKPNSLSSESDEEESVPRKHEDTRQPKSAKSKRKNTSAPNNSSKKCVHPEPSSKNDTLATSADIHQIARPSVYVHRFKCDYCNKLMSVKIDLSQQGNSKALVNDQRRTITTRELSVIQKMSSEAALEVHHRSGKCPLVPLRCELPDSEALFTANSQTNREEANATCGVICRGESMMRYHQENSCLNRLVPCPNSKKGCPEMVSIGSLSLHLKRCLSDLIACPDCSLVNAGTCDSQPKAPYYHRSEIEFHRLTCPNVLIPCPFKGCSFCAIYPVQKVEVPRVGALPISTPISHILLQCGSIVGLDSYKDNVSKLNAITDFLRIEPCEIQCAEHVQLDNSPQLNNYDGHKPEQPNETKPSMPPLAPAYTPANLPPLTSARIRSIAEVAEALSGSGSSASAVFEGLEQLLLSPCIADKATRETERGNKNTEAEARVSRGLVRRSDVPAHHKKLFGFASQTLEQMIDQIFNLLPSTPDSSYFPTRERTNELTSAITLFDLFQLLIASEFEAHTHSGSATLAVALDLVSSTIFAMFAAGIGVYERENISLEPVAACPVDLKVRATSSASDHDKATILSFSYALRNTCEKLISVRVCRLANSQLRRKVDALECNRANQILEDRLFELKNQETSFRCKIVFEEEHKRPEPSFFFEPDRLEQFFEVNDSMPNPLDPRLMDEARQTANLSPNFAVDPFIHESKFQHSDGLDRFERLETRRSENRSPNTSIENLIQAETRMLEACAWIEREDASRTREASRVQLIRPRTASIAQEYTRYLEKMVRVFLTGPRRSNVVPTPFSRDDTHCQFYSQTLDDEDELKLRVTRNVESLWATIRAPLLKLAWGIRVIEKFDTSPSMSESNTPQNENEV